MATALEPAPVKSSRPRIHQTQCFIGGQWIPAQSGKTFDTLNPATEEVIASVAEGDAADVDLAVKAARKQFDGGVHAQRPGRSSWPECCSPLPSSPPSAPRVRAPSRSCWRRTAAH